MWRQQSPYLEPQQPLWRPEILGPLEQVSGPAGQLVEAALVKSHCRAEEAMTDDEALSLQADAAEYVEKAIGGHRQLLSATYDVPALSWWRGPLALPRPPLQAVLSVSYYDTAGVLQVLAADQYLVRTPWRQPGAIERAPQKVWPSLQGDRIYGVVIRFRAGYASPAAVPRTLRRAALLLCAWFYDHRGEEPSGEVQQAVAALLALEEYGSYQ